MLCMYLCYASAYGTRVNLNGPIARKCGRLLCRSSEDSILLNIESCFSLVHQVVPKSNTPQKSQNVLMKAFDVLFGW